MEGAGRERYEDEATEALVTDVRSLIERIKSPTLRPLPPAPPPEPKFVLQPAEPPPPAPPPPPPPPPAPAPSAPVQSSPIPDATPFSAPPSREEATRAEEQPPPAPEPVASDDPLPDLGAVPGLDPLAEPGWLRVAEAVERQLGRSHAHVRRAGALRLPEGAKALLRLASAELAQARDRLRAAALLMDDSRPAEPTAVQPVVDAALAVWEPALKAKRVAVRRRGVSESVKARADAEGLRAAVFELLRNVYDALPRGGSVTVAVSREDDGGVRVSVWDSGAGFSPEALAAAFTPFAVPRAGRLGLGLALVRRVARRAGGDADVENPPEGGARVVLRLPPPGAEPPTLSS